MTQETKIILRELAIIHTTLNLIIERQDLLAKKLFPNDTSLQLPNHDDVRISDAIESMKRRITQNHNLLNADF